MPRGNLLKEKTLIELKELDKTKLTNREKANLLNVSIKTLQKIRNNNYDYNTYYKIKEKKVDVNKWNDVDVNTLQLHKIIELLQEINNKLNKKRIF